MSQSLAPPPSWLATPLVHHVLLAEFDEDKGSTLRQQYPSPTGFPEQVMAELMIPDGAHNHRDGDYTFWWFRYPAAAADTDDDDAPISATTTSAATTLQDNHRPLAVPPAGTPPARWYAYSIVAGRSDPQSKRGFKMAALALLSSHPTIMVFGKLLNLFINEYLMSPTPNFVGDLYHKLNGLDFSRARIWSPATVSLLRGNLDRDSVLKHLMGTEYEAALNMKLDVNTKVDPRLPASDASVNIPIDVLDPRADAVRFASSPSPPLRELLHLVYGKGNDPPLRFDVPPHAISQMQALWPWKEATPPILVLLHAVLAGFRIMVVGRACPASKVVLTILAICSMAEGAGTLPSNLLDRTRPFVNLFTSDEATDIDGVIFGMTNPIFEDSWRYWDMCINLDTRRLKLNPARIPSPASPSLGRRIAHVANRMRSGSSSAGSQSHIDASKRRSHPMPSNEALTASMGSSQMVHKEIGHGHTATSTGATPTHTRGPVSASADVLNVSSPSYSTTTVSPRTPSISTTAAATSAAETEFPRSFSAPMSPSSSAARSPASTTDRTRPALEPSLPHTPIGGPTFASVVAEMALARSTDSPSSSSDQVTGASSPPVRLPPPQPAPLAVGSRSGRSMAASEQMLSVGGSGTELGRKPSSRSNSVLDIFRIRRKSASGGMGGDDDVSASPHPQSPAARASGPDFVSSPMLDVPPPPMPTMSAGRGGPGNSYPAPRPVSSSSSFGVVATSTPELHVRTGRGRGSPSQRHSSPAATTSTPIGGGSGYTPPASSSTIITISELTLQVGGGMNSPAAPSPMSAAPTDSGTKTDFGAPKVDADAKANSISANIQRQVEESRRAAKRCVLMHVWLQNQLVAAAAGNWTESAIRMIFARYMSELVAATQKRNTESNRDPAVDVDALRPLFLDWSAKPWFIAITEAYQRQPERAVREQVDEMTASNAKWTSGKQLASVYEKLIVLVDESDENMHQLLACFPISKGGLEPLTLGLFNGEEQARVSALNLFTRIEQHPLGTLFVQELNPFLQAGLAMAKMEGLTQPDHLKQ
ncbi:hypothetical protein BC828DRAFT_384247 [Blastocladiella britannica]|nr:hypothetical protein BC828DRAFT_384247 [Blastocladiella britannica]